MQEDSLKILVGQIKGSKKYRYMAESLIRRIGIRELNRRKSVKEAIQATRNKLHQIGGAFVAFEMPYARWKDELASAYHSGNQAAFLEACKRIIANHASTRERLADADMFYQTIFSRIGKVDSVVDLASGLNPLLLPWMPLGEQTVYHAYDIYEDMVDFLNFFLSLTGRRGHATVTDLGDSVPRVEADVAILLKTLPSLEQSEKGRSLPLLRSITANTLVISFPSLSLGGRAKGMADNYDHQFRSLIAETEWSCERLDFPREMVFLVDKRKASARQSAVTFPSTVT